MTALYRFRLHIPASVPFGTPPTSGTIFGHLCWALRAREGRAALVDFLRELPEKPVAVSDLLPADHLPRPLLAPSAKGPDKDTPLADHRKKIKALRYISIDVWRKIREGANEDGLLKHLVGKESDPRLAPEPPFFRRHRLPHNRIDRRSGKTPEEGGGLWFADELWPKTKNDDKDTNEKKEGGKEIMADLYVQTSHPPDLIRGLLEHVGASGFGRDATYGRGLFTVGSCENMAWLAELPQGSGMRLLSLSQGVITPEMKEARWQRFVLFGKVGREMMAEGIRPWKLPLVLARSGATFAVEGDQGAGPFGRWLTNIHQDRPDIGHNGFHVAIPYRETPPCGPAH